MRQRHSKRGSAISDCLVNVVCDRDIASEGLRSLIVLLTLYMRQRHSKRGSAISDCLVNVVCDRDIASEGLRSLIVLLTLYATET